MNPTGLIVDRSLGKAQRTQHCGGLLGTLRFAQPTDLKQKELP